MRTGLAPWSIVAFAAVLAGGAIPARAQPPSSTDTTRATQDTSRAARDRARDSTRRVTRSVGGEVVPRVTKDAPRPARTTRAPAQTQTPTPTPAATPPATDTTARMAPTPTPTPAMTPPDSTTGSPMDAARAAVAPIVGAMTTEAHAMALLHEANVGEIEAGRRAERQATDTAVRAFAARMVQEHTALDQQTTALAQRLNVTPMLPDSALPQLQMRELQALPTGTAPSMMRTDSTTMRRPDSTAMPMTPRPDSTAMRTDSTMARTDTTMRHAGMMHGAAGSSFDAAYVAQQVAAHARTLALVDAAIQRAQQAELKTALETQVRPRVAEHLRMAQELQTRIGAR
ncbi:DUF4142 domain-containing protein [Roseisolibacter agri]|nr:DUF4142 domain-containing protein [Roseisolibacter agri]